MSYIIDEFKVDSSNTKLTTLQYHEDWKNSTSDEGKLLKNYFEARFQAFSTVFDRYKNDNQKDNVTVPKIYKNGPSSFEENDATYFMVLTTGNTIKGGCRFSVNRAATSLDSKGFNTGTIKKVSSHILDEELKKLTYATIGGYFLSDSENGPQLVKELLNRGTDLLNEKGIDVIAMYLRPEVIQYAIRTFAGGVKPANQIVLRPDCSLSWGLPLLLVSSKKREELDLSGDLGIDATASEALMKVEEIVKSAKETMKKRVQNG